MARSINQVNLMGRLTRDPETRSTTSGKNITTFSLAVDRAGSEVTDFFDVTAWEKLGDIVAQYTQKGSKVFVSGRLQLDKWEVDGDKRQKVSVVANDVTFLDSAQGGDKPAGQFDTLQAAKKEDTVLKDIDDKPIDLSEIPF